MFLNAKLPPQPSSDLIQGANPEPYEIPVYIFVYVALLISFSLISRWLKHPILFQKIQNRFKPSLLTFIKSFILLLLSIWFSTHIGDYPLRKVVDRMYNVEPQIYLLYLGLYLLTLAFIIFQTVVIGKIIQLQNKQKVFFFFFSVFVILLIALLTFEPRFPISGHD